MFYSWRFFLQSLYSKRLLCEYKSLDFRRPSRTDNFKSLSYRWILAFQQLFMRLSSDRYKSSNVDVLIRLWYKLRWKLRLERSFCSKLIRNEPSWFDATGGQFWAKSCEQFCRKVRLKSCASPINDPVILDSGLSFMHSVNLWVKCITSKAMIYKTAHTILFKLGYR